MDTNKKNRPAQQQRRRPPQSQGRPASNRARQDQRRSPDGAQRRKPAAASQQTAQHRQRPAAPAQGSNRPGGFVQQASYAPQQIGQEMVFKPNQNTVKPRNPEAAKRAAMRKRSAQRSQERKKLEQRRKKRPAVAYTQPKPFNLNRLLLQLAAVVAVVLAISMGMSVFFKVETVKVYGNKAYSAWTVQSASGIENGENLLSLGNTRACGKIMAALPYVENVRIGINLPNTVNIYIEEIDVAYAISSQNGTWWLMTSGGKVVEQTDGATASAYTKVIGVTLDTPVPGEQARAVEEAPAPTDATEETDSTESTAPVTVTGAEKLNAALLILQSLELNDIVGEVASVDVSSLNNIELWYGQRFQVKVGDTNQIDKKLSWMKSAVAQRNDYEMGVLDISFTTWPDQVGYTPLE